MKRVLRTPFERFVKPTQLALRRLTSMAVDRRFGIRTTDEHVAADLGLEVSRYRRTWRAWGWSGVFRVLHGLRPEPDDVLLDIGCGAGRVVCAATRRPFARVIGLEIDPAFAAIAQSNVASLRGPQCSAEVLNLDARTYEVPDDVSIVFLYNPFQGTVFDQVMDRVLDSYERVPRRLRVVYANPVESERLAIRGRFSTTRRMRLSWRPGANWVVSQEVVTYEIVGSHA